MLAVKTPPTPPAAEHVVLVIDDDPAVRSSLKFSLEIEGFTVRVYSGAHELLSDDLPAKSCLLIDYYMPTMNGLELLARLRDRGVSIPAVVITGHPNCRLRERIAAAGVPLLEKPFLGTILRDRIREALGFDRA
jgi:two-component system, LuxR family, response regulator FixJ